MSGGQQEPCERRERCEECARLEAERLAAARALNFSRATDCVVLLRRHHRHAHGARS